MEIEAILLGEPGRSRKHLDSWLVEARLMPDLICVKSLPIGWDLVRKVFMHPTCCRAVAATVLGCLARGAVQRLADNRITLLNLKFLYKSACRSQAG